jgi:transposase
MRWTRRDHIAGITANGALAVIRGDKTLGELAGYFNVHPNQIQNGSSN